MNESTLQGRASEMLRSALLSQEGVLLFILVLSVLLLSTQTDVYSLRWTTCSTRAAC